MKRSITSLVLGLFVVPALALAAATVSPAASTFAACNTNQLNVVSGADCAQGDKTQSKLFGDGSLFQTISNILLFLIGAVSVIMLIIGGFRYVLSNGDSSAITGAKNTIFYAVIGIVVALLAYAIVNFVLTSFVKGA